MKENRDRPEHRRARNRTNGCEAGCVDAGVLQRNAAIELPANEIMARAASAATLAICIKLCNRYWVSVCTPNV